MNIVITNPVNSIYSHIKNVVSATAKDILKEVKSNYDPLYTLGYSRYETLSDKQLTSITTYFNSQGISNKNIYFFLLEKLQFMNEQEFINFSKSF